MLARLVGPEVFRKDILELSGRYLADYDTERITVSLTVEERAEYASQREVYLDFVRSQGIRMGSPSGFQEFIMRSATSVAGRQAMVAYRRQRELAFAAPGKLDVLESLLAEHRGDRMLVCTEDNRTAYAAWKDQFGSSGCVGCGRCITWCPGGEREKQVLSHQVRPALSSRHKSTWSSWAK